MIAESLQQFLRLGCVYGYGQLASLSLDKGDALRQYFAPIADPGAVEVPEAPFEVRMLPYLRERLKLEPWTEWQSLRAIQQQYKNELRLPPDVVE